MSTNVLVMDSGYLGVMITTHVGIGRACGYTPMPLYAMNDQGIRGLALSCVVLHSSTAELRESQGRIHTLEQELLNYRPPMDWARRLHFRTDAEEEAWRTAISQELCDGFVSEVFLSAEGIPLSPPMANRSRDYLVPGLPWSYDNPVIKSTMCKRVAITIEKDEVLSTVYPSTPELLMRRWWDELEGWCRAYGASRARAFDPAAYDRDPAAYERAESERLVDDVTKASGFGLMARIRTEMWATYPPSREAGLWVSFMRCQ
jgi:hypothetical protein